MQVAGKGGVSAEFEEFIGVALYFLTVEAGE